MRFVPLPPTRQRHARTSHYDPLKRHSGCKCWPGRLCIARSTMTASLCPGVSNVRFDKQVRRNTPRQSCIIRRHPILQKTCGHDNPSQTTTCNNAAVSHRLPRFFQSGEIKQHTSNTPPTTSKESVGIHCCCNGRRHGTRAFDETKQNSTRIHGKHTAFEATVGSVSLPPPSHSAATQTRHSYERCHRISSQNHPSRHHNAEPLWKLTVARL